MVWWIIWFAFLFGVVQIYFFLGKTNSPRDPDSSFHLVLLAPFILSSLVRWIVLPRIQKAQPALPLFIVGIALSEASCFIGIFAVPAYKQELFALSILGIAQFAPFFARKYYS